MHRNTLLTFLLLCGPLGAAPTLYQYRDASGVVHLSNLRSDDRYQPLQPIERTGSPSAPARELGRLIAATATAHGIEVGLLHAIIAVESAYNPQAMSPKGAIGLMQLMPDTGARFGARNLLDPEQNLAAGTRYLKSLLEKYDGNLTLAIAAYNAGEGAVARYRNTIPPFPETRDYVAKILARYRSAASRPPVPAFRQVLVISGEQDMHTELW